MSGEVVGWFPPPVCHTGIHRRISLVNLDSSFGFSRRAAEVAEHTEKVPKKETFNPPPTHVTTENGFTQMLKA